MIEPPDPLLRRDALRHGAPVVGRDGDGDRDPGRDEGRAGGGRRAKLPPPPAEPRRRARRAGRVLWPVTAVVVTLGVLFVTLFPVRSYFDQRQAIADAEAGLAALEADNRALEERVAALDTPEEIERIAREQLNLVRPGEEAFAVLPPQPPTDLPDLFPYPLARLLLEAGR